MFIRTTRDTYRLAKDDPIQRGILATLAGSFTFAFILSFKQGSMAGYSAEVFSFVILIERQGRLLASTKSAPVENALHSSLISAHPPSDRLALQ